MPPATPPTTAPSGWSGLTGSISSDPLSAILLLMNTVGGFFNTQQEQQMQQQVFGEQQNAANFAQDPNKMNQLIGKLQDPYSLQTMMTGPSGQQANQYFNQFQKGYGDVANQQTAQAANQYQQAFQNPYSNVANTGTGAQNQQYLQSQQTPYQKMLAQQDPSQMTSLENQYTQGLNSALTANTWNAVQSQLANSGMTQSPGMQSYALAQALAPTEQQNVALGAQQAAAPIQYGLQEQQYGLQAGQLPINYQLAQQQYGLQASQQPLNWLQGQQGYGLQAGQIPLNYQLGAQNLASNVAQNALQYPFQIGSGLAGMFPNYQYAAGG